MFIIIICCCIVILSVYASAQLKISEKDIQIKNLTLEKKQLQGIISNLQNNVNVLRDSSKKNENAEIKQDVQLKTKDCHDETERELIEKTLRYKEFEKIENGSVLKYQYDENVCIFDFNDFERCKIGDDIDFVPEKDNPHDRNAVAVYLDGVKLGYVYRSQKQDMINSWIDRNHYLRGYICDVDSTNKKIYYKIGFYKPLESFKSNVFALTKTSKKIDDIYNRQDGFIFCKVGEPVKLEYNDETETYFVYNKIYDEIGELSVSTSEKLSEIEDDGTDICGIIDKLTINDNDKYQAKIRVYYV